MSVTSCVLHLPLNAIALRASSDDVARSVRDRKLGCEHAAFVAHKQVAQC
jgi:hypothetical protein